MPGFSRPITPGMKFCWRCGGLVNGAAAKPHALHMSTSPRSVSPGWRKSRGMTPTIV
jgi:hypothetical protein